MKEPALSDEEVARSTAPTSPADTGSTTSAQGGHEPPQRDITDGGPDMVQFLAADGSRVPLDEVNQPYAAYLEELDDDALRGMLRDLILVRRVDSEGFALQRQGELGLWAQSLG